VKSGWPLPILSREHLPRLIEPKPFIVALR
jgi:hypothetical protein